MKKIIFAVVMLFFRAAAPACTNFIVGREASADGSVICTYNADDYGMFTNLPHFPASHHPKGEMVKIYDIDTREYHGQIPQAEETYNVIGYINEWQVTIGETTFGGRQELVDSTAILDYGSLMRIALQRSKTAREAIDVMTTLAETYGFCSEGETFSVCDAKEAWIMEMTGKGTGAGGAVWIACRIPADAICAHANQSRIRHVDLSDKDNVLISKDCITFARENGFFAGGDDDFSFCDAFAPADFEGRRYCEARVWAFFNHFSNNMERYLPYAMGKDDGAEPMPLWIVPDRKVSLEDVMACMRDHYEGTPFSLDNDIGGGIWNMPYRPTPLSFTIDGKKYFNERPTSTQQTGASFVSQMRSWMPRHFGGIYWYANDDANMAVYTPIYCGITVAPRPYDTPGADAVTFSFDNAYWVCNWVSNMIYPRYELMFGSLKQVRDSLETAIIARQTEIDRKAKDILDEKGETALTGYLNSVSAHYADTMLARWKELAIYLIVKYNDMIIKPDSDGVFLRTSEGLGAPPVRPGYNKRFARELIRQTGDRYVYPIK